MSILSAVIKRVNKCSRHLKASWTLFGTSICCFRLLVCVVLIMTLLYSASETKLAAISALMSDFSTRVMEQAETIDSVLDLTQQSTEHLDRGQKELLVLKRSNSCSLWCFVVSHQLQNCLSGSVAAERIFSSVGSLCAASHRCCLVAGRLATMRVLFINIHTSDIKPLTIAKCNHSAFLAPAATSMSSNSPD